ncbi:unnamed protein product [Allacma fusca]|uniref:DNA replication ATP-dependent helicase/nuclease n=1 Tax=Allacma fusca TaxID=39272 RepID=A0A8J2KRH5_9HEXA|nr:unnamed protein product [Allacma fusca]
MKDLSREGLEQKLEEVYDIDWESSFDAISMTPDKCELGTEVDPHSIFVKSQQRYLVVSKISTPSDSFSIYEIKGERSGTPAVLELHDLWHQQLVLEPGNLVNIVDNQQDLQAKFKITRDGGFVVVEPDILLSITSVMNQMWCERKSVLSELVKFQITSLDALRGTIAHDIIGRAMLERVTERAGLDFLVNECLRSPAILNSSYGCKLSQNDLVELVEDLIPHILDFVKNQFVSAARGQGVNFVDICDIEDTYWNPVFGLKGKLDATVKVRGKNNQEKIIPFEFKTGHSRHKGKQVTRSEHTGQVSLYTLLIRPRYGFVDSGLLLYIRESFLKEHKVPLLELQYLVCMRNRLAVSTGSSKGHLKLPRPGSVDFQFKCERCEFQSVCATSLRANPAETLPFLTDSETKLQTAASYLQPDDLEFFQKWMKVITLEIEENGGAFHSRHLWKSEAKDREAKGTCLSNLEFKHISPAEVLDSNGNRCYLLTLAKSNFVETKSKTLLSEKDLIILSTQFEICISYGTIEAMTDTYVTLTIERKLNQFCSQQHIRFTVDKVVSVSVLQTQYMYLSKIMEPNPEALRIRNHIVRKSPSKFAKLKLSDDSLIPIQPILIQFNADQQKVMLKSLQTDSFLFVKGMPGTGKTETIVGLLQILVKMNFTVLLVAYTNNAVDNILLKYKDVSPNFLRIGDGSRLAGDALRPFSTSELAKQTANLDILTLEYSSRPVVGSTLLSLKHEIFRRRKFDYCIIDEASQALPTSVLGALMLANKYILFGDPDQLPAIIKSNRVKEMNIEDSMFTLAAQPVNTVKLSIQYRMNSVIMELANKLVYKGQMSCGGEVQSESFLELPTHQLKKYVYHLPRMNQRWISYVLSKKLIKSIVFLETSLMNAFEEKIGESTRNVHEAEIVRLCVQSFVECGCKGTEIGIIAPFRGQVANVRQVVHDMGDQYKCVEVNTVDQYQGRDKDIIICSFTKSKAINQDTLSLKQNCFDNEIKQSILDDIRRLNVAVTRAKKKLVMIGNRLTLQQFTPFQRLFQILESEQIVSINHEDTKVIQGA